MELKLTKLTYTRLEDNFIRHRGDRFSQVTNCIVHEDTRKKEYDHNSES